MTSSARRHRCAAAAAAAGIACATLLWAAPCAAQFVAIDVQRSVAIEGHLSAVDTLSGATRLADFADAQASPPLTGPQLRTGMSLALPDGLADAQGSAALDTFFGERSLSFAGLADVAAQGYGDGSLTLTGWGHASAGLTLHFELVQGSLVRLSMDSAVAPNHLEDLRFLLARGDGTPLWQQTSIVGADGVVRSRFAREFQLAAGDYTVSASLDAASLFDGSQGFTGRTSAEFVLSVVPEPGSAWLLLAGLAGLALFVRRQQRPNRAARAATMPLRLTLT